MKRSHLLALALGAALLVHAWWWLPLLRGDGVLYLRDLLVLVLPYKVEAARTLLRGEWPALSLAIGGGMPLWAHPSTQVADPGTLLFALIAPGTLAQGWDLFLHSMLAGVATFFLGRAVGLRPLWAVYASLAYVSCGPVASAWVIRAVIPAAIPLVVLGAALVARGRFRWGGLTTAVGTAWLCLHPDPPSVGSALLLAAVVCVARAPRSQRAPRTGSLISAGIVGALISAAFLVPALHVVGSTSRGAMARWSAQTSLGWRWIELLAPNGLGVPGASGGLLGAMRDYQPEGIFAGSLYVGGSVLCGVLLALLGPRNRVVRWLLWCALGMLIVAHGDVLPGMQDLWSLLHARFPEKFLAPAYLSLILVAALSLQRGARSRVLFGVGGAGLLLTLLTTPVAWRVLAWINVDSRPRAADAAALLADQLALGSTVLGAGALALGWVMLRRPQWLPVAALALVSVEGTLSTATTVMAAPAAALKHPGALAGVTLPADTAVFCCSLSEPSVAPPTSGDPRLPPWSAIAEFMHVGGPLMGVIQGWRYPVALDFGTFDSPLTRQVMTQELPRLAREAGVQSVANVLAQWGIQYVIDVGRGELPGLQYRQEDRTPHLPVRVIELSGSRMRVQAFSTALPTQSVQQAVQLLAAPEPRVVVPGGVALLEPGGAPVLTELSSSTTHAEVRVESTHGGVILQRVAFRDGWSATVDGLPSELLPANLLHMAVVVPPGNHVVRFEYRTPGLRMGVGLSVLGLVLLGLLLRRRG